MKFGVNEVFDLQIYNKDGLAFIIDTCSKNVITRSENGQEAIFIVEDALVDKEVLNDILSGKYDNMNLRIKGQSVFRGLDLKDYDVELSITIARLRSYNICIGHIDVSRVTFEFGFPPRDAYGFRNAVVELKDKKVDKFG